MDSTSDTQEPTTASADSQADGQEESGSRVDNSAERINGLMKLVGRRTTEVSQQKARADKAEAELVEAQTRLHAYEAGARMSDDEAAAATAATAEQEQATDTDDTDTDDDEAYDPFAGLDDADETPTFWGPTGQAAHTYVDPNSVSRMRSMTASTPSRTQRLQADFNRGLDGALDDWDWKPADR